jgi:hypothetical protein
MLMNRIGPSELCVSKSDGHDKRKRTDGLWEDAMPLCAQAQVY